MKYKLMYETKSTRPYYSIVHIGALGNSLKSITGFEYKNVVYITSSHMGNSAYYPIDEMQNASIFFKKLWSQRKKTNLIIKRIEKEFTNCTKLCNYGWKQDWKNKETEFLLRQADIFQIELYNIFGTMLVSQPQHVEPLEIWLQNATCKLPNREFIIRASTQYIKDMPWTTQDQEIGKLKKRWNKISEGKKKKHLQYLVNKYGWFNEIEGDKPFDETHYENLIKNFERNKIRRLPIKGIPNKIKRIGQLIGKLGYLRFWNRYHFMHCRYHLKQILKELVRRSKHPELEFATVAEIREYFEGKEINFQKIIDRKSGYVSVLRKGKTILLTGIEANNINNHVLSNLHESIEIKGKIGNPGIIQGNARIISFAAKDYHRQVNNFKKGEILVTGMTRPQIVHLCKLASAIVTDEGGITSHAAVISREFDIPCIIGTGNATKRIRSGDMIEVDANKGIVNIIK